MADPAGIEATPEMIKAGVTAFYECDIRVEDAKSIVETIWHAMAKVHQKKRSAGPLKRFSGPFLPPLGDD